VVAIYKAGQRSAGVSPQQSAPSYSSSSGTASMVMPNFVGSATVQQAADQLRARLGQQLSVQAPGGTSTANQLVVGQYPPAGQTVHSMSMVTLYPASGSGSYTSGSGSYSSSAQAQPSQPAGTYGAGTYVVGTDIQAGTYRTSGPTSRSGCYWGRLEDTTGNSGSIITNGIAQGPTTLAIQASDGAVKLSGSCIWTRR
jgi:hypothetical protein